MNFPNTFSPPNLITYTPNERIFSSLHMGLGGRAKGKKKFEKNINEPDIFFGNIQPFASMANTCLTKQGFLCI